MQVHWGNLLVGVAIGVVLVHVLLRVQSGGGRIQQSPS